MKKINHMTDDKKQLSNIGRLVALVTATKVIGYWTLPASMMGLMQIAAEELWVNFAVFDYGAMVSSLGITDIKNPLNWTQIVDITHTCATMIQNKSAQITLYHIMLTVTAVICLYVLRNLPQYAKEMGMTDNYYTSLVYHYRDSVINNHSSLIMSPEEQELIINTHLMPNNFFQRDYDRYMYFFYEYDNLPSNDHSKDLEKYKNIYIPDLFVRHYFSDPEFEVHGYVYWRYKNIDINVTKKSIKSNEKGEEGTLSQDTSIQTKIPILQMVINKSVNDYIMQIRDKKSKEKQGICLYFCHITAGNRADKLYAKVMSSYTTYGDGWIKYFKKHYADEEERNWIDTFFHPLKNEIWPKLKMIHFDPQSICKYGQYPQASYCLYGPPGTGKSTLVYRVAKALGRGIISINISGIRTTLELRQIINGMFLEKIEVYGTGKSSSKVGINSSPRYMVVVFDEFDKAILALKAKSDLKAKKEKDRMRCLSKAVGGQFNGYMSAGFKQGQRNKCLPADEKEWDHPSFNSMLESEPELDSDAVVDQNMTEEEKKKATGMNEQEVDKAIKDLTDMENDDLTVDSLLDIIQGPCANPGAIVFAITNKYEEIRDICPRLFRDGRFKPVYCGYPTRATLNQITRYYFDRSIMGTEYDYIPDVIRISTARLTNRAVDFKHCYTDKEEQFKMYIEHLKFDMKHYKLSEAFKQYETCSDTDLSAQCPASRISSPNLSQVPNSDSDSDLKEDPGLKTEFEPKPEEAENAIFFSLINGEKIPFRCDGMQPKGEGFGSSAAAANINMYD
jgi:DNA polymerase III delta prime subunit